MHNSCINNFKAVCEAKLQLNTCIRTNIAIRWSHTKQMPDSKWSLRKSGHITQHVYAIFAYISATSFILHQNITILLVELTFLTNFYFIISRISLEKLTIKYSCSIYRQKAIKSFRSTALLGQMITDMWQQVLLNTCCLKLR